MMRPTYEARLDLYPHCPNRFSVMRSGSVKMAVALLLAAALFEFPLFDLNRVEPNI
jgi:hypothetical protein